MTGLDPVSIGVVALAGAVTIVYVILLFRTWRKFPIATRRLQVFNVLFLGATLVLAWYFFAGYAYNASQVAPTPPGTVNGMLLIPVAILLIPGALAILLRFMRPKTPERQQYLRTFLLGGIHSPRNRLRQDLIRKSTHVIQLAGILAMDWIGYFAIASAIYASPPPTSEIWTYWGMGSLNFLNFSWTWEGWVAGGAVIAMSRLIYFAYFYCLTLVTVTSELCRHSTHWGYAFDRLVHRALRDKEIDQFGSYTLCSAGFLFAGLFLPHLAIVGMLTGWSLGDMAASQVGMRWGKRQILYNGKTWEGTIAGGAVAFAASLPFLGVAWAIAWTGMFVLIDLVTERPIPVSDNLLMPVAATGIFGLLQAAGVALAPLILVLV